MTETLPTDLTHGDLRALLSYWQGLGGDSGLPLSESVDPAELRRWLGHLVVIDVEADGTFVYAYYGEGFEIAFGQNQIGRSIDDLPAPQRHLLRTEYERVRDQAAPVARRYTADFEGQVQTWERLVLPLSGDGETVEKLLVAAYRLS